ncbi:MAG TPA: glycoside hydrolase family 20 zincin-like fold domain-containing protein, partial [Gemmatimonadaceae bacterium]|nr:glycoside hydrolase family 20 zincin-like fold domain-containing protein [Gemmatimonadaceae bacterium]
MTIPPASSRAAALFVAASAVLSGCRSPAPIVPAPSAPAVRVFGVQERLIPAPVSLIELRSAPFTLSESTTVVVEGDTAEVMVTGEWLASILRPSTGFAIPVVRSGAGASPNSIVLRLRPDPGAHVESYELSVTPGTVSIAAPSAVGVFRGVQTL